MNAKIKSIKSSPLKLVYPTTEFDFVLPDDLQCAKPTEERGIRRDEVKLMVSNYNTDQIQHDQFKNLENYLQEGDVLIVNTSGTLKAALEAWRTDGSLVRIHFSSQLENEEWIVEIRQLVDGATKRMSNVNAGEVLALKNGGSIELKSPYYSKTHADHLQLWKVNINFPISLKEYLDFYGMPIRYSNAKAIYPQSYYQTVFSKEMGSTEMPSAGRAFTPEVLARLVAKGIQFAPILLHTGLASLEVDERPYEEYYRVSQTSADLINLARKNNRRIIAVGTTAVRAIETGSEKNRKVKAGEGWTNTYITPQRGLNVVNGLLTGFHEPRASHLLMLEALAQRSHLELSYQAALKNQYQWHEFGDLHLILP